MLAGLKMLNSILSKKNLIIVLLTVAIVMFYTTNNVNAQYLKTVENGLYAEGFTGIFLTVGGNDSYSNAQPCVGMGFGYKMSSAMSLGLSLGFGANEANPISGETAPEDFDVLMGKLLFTYLVPLSDRHYMPLRVGGGMARINPGVIKEEDITMAPMGTFAIGYEYNTQLENMFIGVEVAGDVILPSGAQIIALSIYPSIKYVF